MKARTAPVSSSDDKKDDPSDEKSAPSLIDEKSPEIDSVPANDSEKERQKNQGEKENEKATKEDESEKSSIEDEKKG